MLINGRELHVSHIANNHCEALFILGEPVDGILGSYASHLTFMLNNKRGGGVLFERCSLMIATVCAIKFS